MAKGVYSALSGAIAAQTSLDVTAQNLANASTPGFKKLRPVFRETLANAETAASNPRNNKFTAVASTVIDLAPGVIRSTDRALDIAPKDGSFVAVSTRAGERYVRGGHIEAHEDGTLRINGQALVDPDGKPITVDPEKPVRITEEGQVLVDDETVASLKVVRFQDPSRMTLESATTFAANAASGAAEVTDAGVVVGAVEESNVAPVTAMTELVTTTRVFEAFQRTIDAFRDADRRVVTTLGQ